MTQTVIETMEPLTGYAGLEDELMAAGSREEVLSVLADHGIDVTAEELDELARHYDPETGELDETALEAVNGGMAIWVILALCIVGTIVLVWMIKGFINGIKC